MQTNAVVKDIKSDTIKEFSQIVQNTLILMRRVLTRSLKRWKK